MTTAEAKRIVKEAVEEAVENGKPLLYCLPDASEYEWIEFMKQHGFVMLVGTGEAYSSRMR